MKFPHLPPRLRHMRQEIAAVIPGKGPGSLALLGPQLIWLQYCMSDITCELIISDAAAPAVGFRQGTYRVAAGFSHQSIEIVVWG